ncbi:MliC family protein [Vibrio ordalii]|uniref:MliC family protein n=1 Tax=Vibrio ordalii TaxID=28174 RepID=UPI00256FF6EF|nr:MliC family protein [Vibrio ordalii]
MRTNSSIINVALVSILMLRIAYIEQQSAVLRIAGREYPLIQIPAASGVKYRLDDSQQTQPQTVLLHTKGDEALLEVGSTTYQGCTTQ